MKRENFYRRNPGDALAGMVGMTLEERGVYNTVIDLIYLTWRPLEDNRAYIAGHCGCAVQKANPIIERLIARGKLLRFQEDGCWYLSNRRFEDERTDVKGVSKTRSGRAGVGEKSPEVGEKSAVVAENPALLAAEAVKKQSLKPPEEDKSRVEKTLEPNGSVAPPNGSAAFDRAWSAFPEAGRRRSSRKKSLPQWRSIARSAAGEARLLATVEGFAESDEAKRDGGRFVPAFDRWLRDGRWEHYLPSPMSAASTEDPADVWRRRSRAFVANRYWNRLEWGAAPGEAGCRIAPEIQREVGVEPAPPKPIAGVA